MKLKTLFLIFLWTAAQNSIAQVYLDTFGKTKVQIENAIDSSYFNKNVPKGGLAGAWDVMLGPDGKLWFSNNNKIDKYDPKTGKIKTLISMPVGYFMGIATHPDFTTQPYVYAVLDPVKYYLFHSNYLHLVRLKYDPNQDTLIEQTFFLKWYHIGEHCGGRIAFGNDKKLYVTTAEYNKTDDTLFYNSGKVLRINPDGTVPIDNPRADYTYTWGHRVPQGIVKTPNGNIIISEFGQDNDELNLIVKNNNYGWPYFDGNTCIVSSDTCNKYAAFYKKAMDVGENPPSGIDYYQHPAIPELNGILEAITYNRNGNGFWSQGMMCYGLNQNQDSVTSKVRYLGSKTSNSSAFGRVRDVCSFPDGSIYFIGFDRDKKAAIYKISNPNYNGIKEQKIAYFTVFPNPAENQLTVSAQTPFLYADYQIYNTAGILQHSGLISGNNPTIHTEFLKNGYYVLKISTDQFIQNTAFVKQ